MSQLPATPDELADQLAKLEEQTEQGPNEHANPTLVDLKAELETVLADLRGTTRN